MPFVNEVISSQDSDLAGWDRYKEYQHPWSATPTYWTIDRELGAFIWCIQSPMPECPTQIFGASWKGDGSIRLDAVETLSDVPGDKTKFNASWELMNIRIPESLKSQRGEIESFIKAAFEAFSHRYKGAERVLVSIK